MARTAGHYHNRLTLNRLHEHTYMKTYILQELNKTNAARIDTLLHMLSPDAPTLGHARLAELLAGDSFWLFVAEDADGELAGMLTLTRCHTLSRSKFWIEDVIVDPTYRGQGVGRDLVHAAVEYVRTAGEHEHTTEEQDHTADMDIRTADEDGGTAEVQDNHTIRELTAGCERKPSLYLTSNPKRTAARALYRSEGFEEYETGVFRIV